MALYMGVSEGDLWQTAGGMQASVYLSCKKSLGVNGGAASHRTPVSQERCCQSGYNAGY